MNENLDLVSPGHLEFWRKKAIECQEKACTLEIELGRAKARSKEDMELLVQVERMRSALWEIANMSYFNMGASSIARKALGLE